MMDKKELKVIFMGTPEISAKVFEAMIQDGYQFVGLIAQPDRPVGRKGELEKVPTKKVAEKYNVPVFQPVKIRKEYEFVKELNPDVICVVAYGKILPKTLLEILYQSFLPV